MRGEQETPEVAARAVEALARLNTRKGLLEDAAYYYRLLGQKYPKVIVDGKKGEEYLDDLATDKRFLPYLDEPGRYTSRRKVELDRLKERGSPDSSPTFQFAHFGEPLPFFTRNKLGLLMNYNHHLKLHDSATGEDRWSLPLTPQTQFQQIVSNNALTHRAKFGFQSVGHLVVLQLGHMVFGIDPLNQGRGRVAAQPVEFVRREGVSQQPLPERRSTRRQRHGYSTSTAGCSGWAKPVPCTAESSACKRATRWRRSTPYPAEHCGPRSDVNSRSHVFGDEKHIYVVGTGATGKEATGSRVFRAYDGVSVKVPEFSTHYEQRDPHAWPQHPGFEF